jgi:NAD(P)-dependent dehydrogenase (short-subunit alcohol dehydrogenase family)
VYPAPVLAGYLSGRNSGGGRAGEAFPGEKLGPAGDLSRPEQIAATAGTVIERSGRCDILVSNAAVFPATDLGGVTAELWRPVQAVNAEAMLLAQAFAPGMMAADDAGFVTGQIRPVDGGVTRTGA